jgi:hypothetical protein
MFEQKLIPNNMLTEKTCRSIAHLEHTKKDIQPTKFKNGKNQDGEQEKTNTENGETLSYY